MTRAKPDFIDALSAAQKRWEAGLPWSRFGLPSLALAGLAASAATRLDGTSATLLLVGGGASVVVGVFSLWRERRVRAERAGTRKSGR